MPFRDMLLHLDSYPEPTPPGVIDEAVRLGAKLGQRLSALSIAIHIPLQSNRVADYLVGLSKLAHDEERKSRDAAQAALARFASQAASAGISGEALLERCDLYDLAERVAGRARSRDLCIVPLGGRFDDQRDIAQAAIFGSGRPVVVFTPDTVVAKPSLQRVAIAWDGGRACARAMADALPLLKNAAQVRVVTVVNEKPSARAGIGEAARRHLAAYGVEAEVEVVDAEDRSAGPALSAYAKASDVDLLVMGAYGHSRLREFLLGGATEHMLWRAELPIFFSH